MLIAIAIGFSLLIALLIIIAVKSPAENFIDPSGPLYTGSYAGEQQPFTGRLKVVSWNLNFATRVDKAIDEFRNTPELRDTDIILLQEMDEDGAEKMAQSLGYNYVYYPAAVHRRHNRKFGNAILSRWPLLETQKIILSDSLGGLKHNRIAVRALIDLGEYQIAAYSVHLDMVWMLPGLNKNQLDVLVDRVGTEDTAAVVGGDFNSWTSGSIAMLDHRFGEIGLVRVSQGTGPTLKTYGSVTLILDHIFASEIFASQAGVWQQPQVSDHAAIWTILSIEKVNTHE
jgi:endonuclease/exonuclease/phosphatase family metal-dependent hydrolase